MRECSTAHNPNDPPIFAHVRWFSQHWRMMASWQTSNYSAELASRLDGTVTLALSCLSPLPRLVRVDQFRADGDQATKAFVATGTLIEMYAGMVCSDGGTMSGAKGTPLFQDGCAPHPLLLP